MKKKLQALLKNERGLTLIELLAVVVILGIIAAIAIPSIGGLIDNTKKDAHMANATQMVSSVKTMISGGQATPTTTASDITLATLQEGGYIEVMEDPSGDKYDTDDSKVTIQEVKPPTGKESNASTYTYTVTLKGDAKTAKVYITAKEISALKRSDVTLP